LSSTADSDIGKQLVIAFYLTLAGMSGVAQAQDATEANDRAVTTEDVLADARFLYGPPPPMEDCSDEQEAAILSGEIIVCRRKPDQRQFRTLPSDEAQSRYAEETMNKDNPQTPDVAGGGIFRGPATVSSMCFIPPCPKEPALIIDVTALPKAPPGSDADRIARGLPPLNQDDLVLVDTTVPPMPEESEEQEEEP
jgi:hypothetical protein